MHKARQILLTSGDEQLVHACDGELSIAIVNEQDLLDRTHPDAACVFVDWLLPTMSGLQLCRLLRDTDWGRHIGIIVVIPPGSENLRERALAAGADDYVMAPLTPALLAARIRPYRDAAVGADAPIRVGNLSIDPQGCGVSHAGRQIPLNPGAFRLLLAFARKPNRVLTRHELIGALDRKAQVHDERTVDAWVSRLRRTLQRHGVTTLPRTVRSIGYILDSTTSRDIRDTARN